jgi:hypothetical protein
VVASIACSQPDDARCAASSSGVRNRCSSSGSSTLRSILPAAISRSAITVGLSFSGSTSGERPSDN